MAGVKMGLQLAKHRWSCTQHLPSICLDELIIDVFNRINKEKFIEKCSRTTVDCYPPDHNHPHYCPPGPLSNRTSTLWDHYQPGQLLTIGPFTLASKNRGFSNFANLRWKLLSNFLKTTKKPRQKNPPPEWGFLKLRVKLRELSECKWYA